MTASETKDTHKNADRSPLLFSLVGSIKLWAHRRTWTQASSSLGRCHRQPRCSSSKARITWAYLCSDKMHNRNLTPSHMVCSLSPGTGLWFPAWGGRRGEGAPIVLISRTGLFSALHLLPALPHAHRLSAPRLFLGSAGRGGFLSSLRPPHGLFHPSAHSYLSFSHYLKTCRH